MAPTFFAHSHDLETYARVLQLHTWSACVSCPPPRMRPVEPYPQIAERRFNQALFARLRPKEPSAKLLNGGTFCVGTYHMPCLFNVRPVMVMHTSLAIKHLAKLAGSDPLVFAGDFNFNPDSDCYKLAVQGGKAPPRFTAGH